MTRLARWLSLLGLVVAICCALVALGGPLGSRFGYWHWREAIAMLVNVFWVAFGTAIFCLLAAITALPVRGGRTWALVALLGVAIAGVTAWIPYDLRMTARKVPAIHDITTDLADPPKFVRVATLRGKDDHKADYDRKAGELQKKGYPDLAPLVLKAPKDKVFVSVQVALRTMGLEVVDTDLTQGRIEATATSTLFGFKDDVVVRITTVAQGTKVDVRSKSRVGRNDFGMNAKRIREFQGKLKSAAA